MSTIIAGHFQLQDEVDVARRALADAGFAPERISSFYLMHIGKMFEILPFSPLR